MIPSWRRSFGEPWGAAKPRGARETAAAAAVEAAGRARNSRRLSLVGMFEPPGGCRKSYPSPAPTSRRDFPPRGRERLHAMSGAVRARLFGEWGVIGSMAALRLVVHIRTIRGYGYFRDEFYYVACRRHLDWGYVDHPPFVALVAWIVSDTLGDSLVALRLLPALAGAVVVLLTGLMARRLGGGRFAQALACLAVTVAPVSLSLHHIFSMNAFEQVFWALGAYLVLRILQDDDRVCGSPSASWPAWVSRTSTRCSSSGSGSRRGSCSRPPGSTCGAPGCGRGAPSPCSSSCPTSSGRSSTDGPPSSSCGTRRSGRSRPCPRSRFSRRSSCRCSP